MAIQDLNDPISSIHNSIINQNSVYSHKSEDSAEKYFSPSIEESEEKVSEFDEEEALL